jgi:hypothetical protein
MGPAPPGAGRCNAGTKEGDGDSPDATPGYARRDGGRADGVCQAVIARTGCVSEGSRSSLRKSPALSDAFRRPGRRCRGPSDRPLPIRRSGVTRGVRYGPRRRPPGSAGVDPRDSCQRISAQPRVSSSRSRCCRDRRSARRRSTFPPELGSDRRRCPTRRSRITRTVSSPEKACLMYSNCSGDSRDTMNVSICSP